MNLLWFLAGLLIGGIAMTLVYRNNQKKIEATLEKLQAIADELKK